jgi:chromosomal replication initiation ATPase DnaA
MSEKSDRKELERRLEQAKRAASLGNDPVTTERLQKLIKDLEEQLRLSE